MQLLDERGTRFHASGGKVDAKQSVFYNPTMTHNRDISVLVLKALIGLKRIRTPMRISLPLEASGIRGIRLWKEFPDSITSLRMNDGSPAAADAMKKNLVLNGITDARVTVHNEEASRFLLDNPAGYVDVDPFGFPGPFLDAALRSISRDGILAVTATDTAALCGTAPGACLRKYWSVPMRNWLMHEAGLRILSRKVQLVASQHDRGAFPLYSYAERHYMRAYFSVRKGRSHADRALARHGSLFSCPKCLRFLASGEPDTRSCHGAMRRAGPMDMGPLWDRELAERVSSINGWKDLDRLVGVVAEESAVNAVGFHDLHALVKAHGLKVIPRSSAVLSALRKAGHEASQTHFTGKGIRTTAPLEELLQALRA